MRMRINRNSRKLDQNRSRGFSTLELLIVMMISLIIAALAIPGFNQMRRALRIAGDARDLNGAINQAKLQAAADFTESRIYLDLGANTANTFHIDMWNKAGNGGLGCWRVVGDVNNPCFIPGVSPVQSLSSGVTFGFAGVGAPPPNTQTGGIAQGTQGERCAPVNGKRVGQQATTACIQFNSRGMPIDINTGLPTNNAAFYVTDNTQTFGVTVNLTGLSQVWVINLNGSSNNTWYHK